MQIILYKITIFYGINKKLRKCHYFGPWYSSGYASASTVSIGSPDGNGALFSTS
jgi:hypothetical protein